MREKIVHNPIENKQVKIYGQDEFGEGDLVMCEGQLYKAILHDTGYSIREYYSHETPTKGPGPGWDYRWPMLEKYSVDHPSQLPDEPFYRLELEPIRDDK